ncbi:TraR/DksA family transcriptional regulator [Intrasporangium sp.]|uniref:TraR/DksA family transcriptional regulator n=1 Tax=Intrasporangium sp. TaxID=1925024 RepID=UPI00293A9AC7|nr:TraR/DksA C4-type zinc finger protein [Intrasporangium sp.]MDV3221396.1 TraR/DksA C4-type zinc finger protein [Intrasporangium sp.]
MTDTTTHSTRLAAEHQTTVERLEDLRREFGLVVEATVDSNADDEHDPEGSTIAYERSQVAALIEQAEQHLVEIDDARARLADGTYGLCVVCGQRIPEGRLEARPTARTCIEHASHA